LGAVPATARGARARVRRGVPEAGRRRAGRRGRLMAAAESAAPRAVVVTGAGSGIGRAIAAAFAKLGDAVYALDLSEAAARETAAQLEGHDVKPFAGDVSNHADVERVVEVAAQEHGHLDVLVSAAGVYDAYAGIDDTSPELWQRIL